MTLLDAIRKSLAHAARYNLGDVAALAAVLSTDAAAGGCWAHYETATPGSFHLVPPDERLPAFQADYARMREMILGDAPAWKEILRDLRELEDRVNGRKWARP